MVVVLRLQPPTKPEISMLQGQGPSFESEDLFGTILALGSWNPGQGQNTVSGVLFRQRDH